MRANRGDNHSGRRAGRRPVRQDRGVTERPPEGTARRRRRSTARQGPPAPASEQPTSEQPDAAGQPDTAGQPDSTEARPEPAAPEKQQRSGGRTGRRPRADAGGRDQGERALRDLVGAGHSQLGVSGALRGRDVNRPTDEDLAEAERSVTIVRRNWKPPS